MAKRGAEALACRAPWESHFSHAPLPKRSRSDSERRGLRCAPLWGGGSCKKRKRTEEDDGETAGRKRPAPSKASGPQKEAGPGTASLQGSTRPLPKEAASGSDLDENDVWHYNSFQYWKSPLPTIDLSDILDLEKNDTVEARDSSTIGLSEMET
ncbi:hypothetical protein lerEdw1_000159 [Lerista edwardsae]|nr:hypothetical protein lerEdw1_000159 [Lerista edwardsae]